MTTFTKYVSSNAGLDNILRLVQAIALVTSSRTGSPRWTILFEQLDYIRRPLRMFGWLPCLSAARAELTSNKHTLRNNLSCLKMSFLGLFLFTEMFVLPFSMRIFTGDLGQRLQREAFKFWAYSLGFSVAIHLLHLFWEERQTPPTVSGGEMEKETGEDPSAGQARSIERARIWKHLIVDCCDLAIPLVTVDWIAMDSSLLGVIIIVSTLGQGSDIWAECQK